MITLFLDHLVSYQVVSFKLLKLCMSFLAHRHLVFKLKFCGQSHSFELGLLASVTMHPSPCLDPLACISTSWTNQPFSAAAPAQSTQPSCCLMNENHLQHSISQRFVTAAHCFCACPLTPRVRLIKLFYHEAL